MLPCRGETDLFIPKMYQSINSSLQSIYLCRSVAEFLMELQLEKEKIPATKTLDSGIVPSWLESFLPT